jgi:hypothetical protein
VGYYNTPEGRTLGWIDVDANDFRLASRQETQEAIQTFRKYRNQFGSSIGLPSRALDRIQGISRTSEPDHSEMNSSLNPTESPTQSFSESSQPSPALGGDRLTLVQRMSYTDDQIRTDMRNNPELYSSAEKRQFGL